MKVKCIGITNGFTVGKIYEAEYAYGSTNHLSIVDDEDFKWDTKSIDCFEVLEDEIKPLANKYVMPGPPEDLSKILASQLPVSQTIQKLSYDSYHIDKVKNGFVLHCEEGRGLETPKYVFESSKALATFIAERL